MKTTSCATTLKNYFPKNLLSQVTKEEKEQKEREGRKRERKRGWYRGRNK